MKQLSWNPLSVYAINKAGSGWFSGRVMDMLTFGNAMVVATQWGGIWIVNKDTTVLEGYPTFCITDQWDDPDVNCLCNGPDNANQVYAGCNNSLHYFELANGTNGPSISLSIVISLPIAIATFYRIAVQHQARQIIVATGSGVWWSAIPTNPSNASGYIWSKAIGLPTDKIAGLCKAADNAVHAALWGDGLDGNNHGIFKGLFQNNQLTFTRSVVNWKDQAGTSTRISLASCSNNQSVAYAVCSKSDDTFRGVLKYDDANDQWNDMEFNKANITPAPGGQGGFNNCIAVAPNESNLVAFGWQMGTYVHNTDGTWKILVHPTTHHDMHGLLFTDLDNGMHRLYVGGDGGILEVTHPQDEHPEFNDQLNVFLSTLLFKDSLRRAYATVDVSSVVDGLIAGGLQDNGVKYLKTAKGKYTSWLQVLGADGGTNTFLTDGTLITRESNAGNRFSGGRWNFASNDFDPLFSIPIDVSVDTDQRMEICSRVISPYFRNKEGQLMVALSAAKQTENTQQEKIGAQILLGLFCDEGGTHYHWQVIGHADTEIKAIASLNGEDIFIGTADGKMFIVSPDRYLNGESAFSYEMSIPSLPAGYVCEFGMQPGTPLFALYKAKTQSYLLSYDRFSWKIVTLPVNEIIFSLALDWSDKTIFISTDTSVYQGVQNNFVTGLPGNYQLSFTWVNSSDGLPVRPHCNHLRTGYDDGKFYLYLSTYGRSIYRAEIGSYVQMPGQGEEAGVQVLFGVIEDGGGKVIDPNTGRIIIIPPRQPVKVVLQNLLVNEMVRGMKDEQANTIQRSALDSIKNFTDDELKGLSK